MGVLRVRLVWNQQLLGCIGPVPEIAQVRSSSSRILDEEHQVGKRINCERQSDSVVLSLQRRNSSQKTFK